MRLSVCSGRTETRLLRDICEGETCQVDDRDREASQAGEAGVELASYQPSLLPVLIF